MTGVSVLELGYVGPDLFEVADDLAVEDLFLLSSVEPFGDEGKVRRGTPELDLVEEVLGGVLRAMLWPPEPTCMNSAGLKLRTGFAALIP